ncbi:DNA-3-methyladenine glycosylase [bacterium]|nr:DNA-3-methyladenine glycosylase [bacterium]
MKPKYWQHACQELSRMDPVMKAIIHRYKGETLASRGEPFETLFRSIVGQQISVKAAQSVWNRVTETLKTPQNPETVMKIDAEVLRACGLSTRKVEYSKDLAEKFLDKTLNSSLWPKMTDEEVIEQLIVVRGIGRWTAEMFLIFSLLRPNVFPADYLGLQKAISLKYKKRYPLTDKNLILFRKKYEPWATVATWYLWRSLDPIPVEY